MTRPLTARGETDRVTLTTGTLRPGDNQPDWAQMALPGSLLVLYMAVHKADEVQANLLKGGLPSDTEVSVVASASHPHEKILDCALDEMAEAIAAEGIQNPAVLMIRCPKDMAQGDSKQM